MLDRDGYGNALYPHMSLLPLYFVMELNPVSQQVMLQWDRRVADCSTMLQCTMYSNMSRPSALQITDSLSIGAAKDVSAMRIMPCTPLTACFGEAYRSHLQGPWRILRPWKRRRHVPPKVGSLSAHYIVLYPWRHNLTAYTVERWLRSLCAGVWAWIEEPIS
jgi:hypothetical protein